MQGADMQEVWFIKIFALFGKIVAGVLARLRRNKIPAVDFEQLKQLWIDQSEHHIAI